MDRVIQIIENCGVVGLAFMLTWGAVSCFETKHRYHFEIQRLEKGGGNFDALQQCLSDRERLEMSLHELQGGAPRGTERATNAPLRER